MALNLPSLRSSGTQSFARRLWIGVLMANLLVLVMAAELMHSAWRSDQEQAATAAENLAVSLDHSLGHLFDRTDMALAAVAAEVDQQRRHGGIRAGAVNAFLADLHKQLPAVNSIRVVDEQGDILFGTGLPAGPNVNVADRDYFERLSREPNLGLVISKPVVGRVSGRWAINLARRLNYPDGSFAGVVLAPIELSHLRELFADLKVGPHGVVALRDGDLSMVVRVPEPSGADNSVGQSAVSAELRNQLAQGQSQGSFQNVSPIDGIERRYIYRKITGHPLYVFVGLAPEDYLTDWRREALRMGLLVLLFVGASSFAAMILARSWRDHQADADRLRKLSRAVEQSQASIVITDKTGAIEYVNPQFVRNTGYTLEEAIGQNPRILKTEHTSSEEYERLWAALLAKETYRVEFLNRRKDGSTYWEDAILSSVVDEAGEIVNFVAVKVDITERKRAMEALADSEMLWHFALEGAGDGVWDWDRQTNQTKYSRRWKEMLGYNDEDIGTDFGEWQRRIHPEDLPATMLAVQQFVEGGQTYYLNEYRMRCKDGSWKWILAHGMVVSRSEDGKPLRMIGTHTDITERKNLETTLRSERDFAQSLIDTAQAAILVLDPQGRIVRFNPYLETLSGYALAEVKGQDWFDTFLPEADRERTRALFRQAIGDINTRGIVDPILARDGRQVPIEWYDRTLKDSSGNVVGLLAVGLDVSSRMAVEAQLEFLAYYDPVTQLPNRTLVQDRLMQAIAFAARASSQVALLYLDMDNFKTVNDSLGHDLGDKALKEIALRLSECIRDSDTVGRFGGDEFLVVLTDLRDPGHASAVADKILERVAAPIAVAGHEVYLSGSLGIALFPGDGENYDSLLKKADTAMYQAKSAGRNAYRFFADEMNLAAAEHLAIRSALVAALDRDEFVLHYQPQVGAHDGRVRGVEALIRWRHPDRGLVAPGHFIAIAEASGLIVPIGEWVLREACRQAMRWSAGGLPDFTMAVNLSAVQFRRGNLEETVRAALLESRLPPHRLELELTESILLLDDIHLAETLSRIKALGVRISIDDFGTGYSNLTYLRRFAVDKLKIDQSFVRNIAHSADDMTIVQSLLLLAKRMRIATIAEGVEESRQLDYLRIVHCDEIQGYLIARPLPADDLVRFVARSEASPRLAVESCRS